MTQVLEEIMPRGALKREIKKQSPNTRRLGCPSSSVLREMAGDSQAHTKLFYHVLLCGACVEDFERYQKRLAQPRSGLLRDLLLAAAGMLLTLGIWWCLSRALIISQHDKISQRQPAPSPSKQGSRTAANSSGQQMASESFPKRPNLNAAIPVEIVESSVPIVEYTIFSATRDATPEFSEPETLSLRRERIKLRIHLPLGSEEGNYRVRLQRKTDGKAIISRIARASRSNNFTLTIEGDFGKLRTGAYSLEILPPGYMGKLPDYPVELVDGKKGPNTKGHNP
jgi:hypothetical protein